MEIIDTPTRLVLTRIIAKRKEFIIRSIQKLFPERKEDLEEILQRSLQNKYIEPAVSVKENVTLTYLVS